MTKKHGKMLRRDFLLGATALGVAGCGDFPTYEKPTTALPAQFGQSQVSQSITLADARWWSAFNDPAMNRLVDIGLKQNLDIRKAVARIEQAQGVFDAAGFPFSGQIRVGEAKYNNASDADRTVTGFARAEASWRIDLFGKLENEKASAEAGLDAAYEDADIWRLTLLTDVLSAYIDLRYAQELLRINDRVTKTREATLAATKRIQEQGRPQGSETGDSTSGTETGDDQPDTEASDNAPADGAAGEGTTDIAVAQARALLANSRAQKPELEIVFVQTLNRIMRLVGVTQLPSQAQFDRRAPQPIPTTRIVQTGVPSDLLRNRPDIVRAENRFEQAAAAVGVASADLYPGLVLTGNIALNESSANPLVSAGFLRLGIDVPLFDLPVRQGRKAAAIGLAEERRLEWEKQVLEAVEEVRNVMFAMERHRIAIIESEDALKAAEDVLDIARREYGAGNLTFLQVGDAERALLSAENALALDKRNYAIDFVKLNVALGGRYAPQKRT